MSFRVALVQFTFDLFLHLVMFPKGPKREWVSPNTNLWSPFQELSPGPQSVLVGVLI